MSLQLLEQRKALEIVEICENAVPTLQLLLKPMEFVNCVLFIGPIFLNNYVSIILTHT